MKKLLLFASLFVSIILISCNKNSLQNATVVKDCTGAYIQIEGKDYYVCNEEEMTSFTDGQKVEVSVIGVEGCQLTGVCLLFHPNSGYVEVTNIK